MSGLIIIVAMVLAIVILDALASRYGVDSRQESRDPRSPVRGISIEAHPLRPPPNVRPWRAGRGLTDSRG